MLGLTAPGVVHTLASLVALVCGFRALARDHEIKPGNLLGQVYLAATVITAGTALVIFQHHGFGPGHALAIVTLLALTVGSIAAFTRMFGRWSRDVQAIGYSSTLLFHLIPGVTEALTRLPFGHPVLANAEAPEFRAIYGALLMLFLVGITFQLRWLHAHPGRGIAPLAS